MSKTPLKLEGMTFIGSLNFVDQASCRKGKDGVTQKQLKPRNRKNPIGFPSLSASFHMSPFPYERSCVTLWIRNSQLRKPVKNF